MLTRKDVSILQTPDVPFLQRFKSATNKQKPVHLCSHNRALTRGKPSCTWNSGTPPDTGMLSCCDCQHFTYTARFLYLRRSQAVTKDLWMVESYLSYFSHQRRHSSVPNLSFFSSKEDSLFHQLQQWIELSVTVSYFFFQTRERRQSTRVKFWPKFY